MAIPLFYIEKISTGQNRVNLDEDTSRHVVQVLRMKNGEKINLTDGKGVLYITQIISAHKKHCEVEILETNITDSPERKISIAISLLKNSNRFEWFLEKATEIGVSEIIPLICERTEKDKFRKERLQTICISAMLQSQQTWLPVLQEPVKIKEFFKHLKPGPAKFIAHCGPGEKALLSEESKKVSGQAIILIGPEGDFSSHEIEFALQNGFLPVNLGENRLRTETAGLVATILLCY